MRRHLILVGLPGSGKSTVGRAAAETLGAAFVDVDGVIVRRMQMPVARVFAELGEARFRMVERETVAQALAGEPAVIAPGGGWAAQPEQVETARASGLVVYLRCIPGTATRRSAQGEARPLLVGEDPGASMRKLLADRSEYYEKADAVIDVDIRPAVEIAARVCALARERAGW